LLPSQSCAGRTDEEQGEKGMEKRQTIAAATGHGRLGIQVLACAFTVNTV